METTRDVNLSLVCPACGKAPISLSGITGSITCPQCSHSFPTKNGFVDLLVNQPDNVPPVDVTMEWKWLIDIYESALWRRNPIVSALLGISFKQEQRKIFDVLALKGDETILDLACGPGIYARAFAKRASRGSVVGFDLSVPMLNYAADRARRQNLNNILFVRGNAMDLPFMEDSFDVVNCCGALHLFPEHEQVVHTVHKILKPGGRFTVAAARRPEGKVAQKIIAYSGEKSGTTYYTDQRILSLLQDAGFTQKTLLYHRGIWVISYAKK